MASCQLSQKPHESSASFLEGQGKTVNEADGTHTYSGKVFFVVDCNGAGAQNEAHLSVTTRCLLQTESGTPGSPLVEMGDQGSI